MQTDAFSICVDLWTVVAMIYLAFSLLNRKKIIRTREKKENRLVYLLCLITGMALIFYSGLPYGVLLYQIHKTSVIFNLTGIILTVAGILFSLWARSVIGSNWSGVVLVKKDHELIRTGAYAIVRHPTYCGFIFALAGTVIVLNEWRGMVGFVILAVSFLWKISKEEKMLKSQFPDYSEYQKRTKKLIPFLF